MVTASHVYFGFTHLDGKLVTVGGRRHNQPTRINDVYMFQKSEKWKRSIPPMPAARSHTTVVNYQSTIIVVSGGVMHWLGLDQLCWHNFENNRHLKELGIMLE